MLVGVCDTVGVYVGVSDGVKNWVLVTVGLGVGRIYTYSKIVQFCASVTFTMKLLLS